MIFAHLMWLMHWVSQTHSEVSQDLCRRQSLENYWIVMEIITIHEALFDQFLVRVFWMEIDALLLTDRYIFVWFVNLIWKFLGIMLLLGGIFYAIFADGTVQPWANDVTDDDSDERKSSESWQKACKMIFYVTIFY